MECTWNKIVKREKGAVTVFAIDPAKPPQNSCFMASFERDDDVLDVFDVVVV